MYPDPIVAEIRAIRERLAAKFNYDLEALVKYAQERDAADNRVVVRRQPRPPIQLPTVRPRSA